MSDIEILSLSTILTQDAVKAVPVTNRLIGKEKL